MKSIERIELNLLQLRQAGVELTTAGQKKDVNLGTFGPQYESWYTKALAAIAQITPERLSDFKEAYRNEKRREVTYTTYTISDFLLGLRVNFAGSPVFDATQAFAHKMLRQVGIVAAAAEIAPSVLRDIRATLRSELLDSDVQAARGLLKAGHLRSAGVVCGVVIETHLQSMCSRRSVTVPRKNPSIGDLNEALKAAGAYDHPTYRLIQRLADIRNICGHRKERDPKPDEIEDIISGTDKIVKEVN